MWISLAIAKGTTHTATTHEKGNITDSFENLVGMCWEVRVKYESIESTKITCNNVDIKVVSIVRSCQNCRIFTVYESRQFIILFSSIVKKNTFALPNKKSWQTIWLYQFRDYF